MHPLQGGVDGNVPQIGVEDRQPDGGLGNRRVDSATYRSSSRNVGSSVANPSDPPIRVQQHRGDTEEVHQPARLRRTSLRLAGVSPAALTCVRSIGSSVPSRLANAFSRSGRG
ncbi:hypothetical protein [Streptomyces sp. PvR034]|uniref:hypothetical protein n=1 Tax=Streptomyces sp. PvR034 TaxID=3156401 RepID=UPI003398AD5E